MMRIFFIQNCLWLTLFFVNSPFRSLNFNWQQLMENLPLFSYFFGLFHKKSNLKNEKINT